MAISFVVADAMLADKFSDIWPDYSRLYDVRSPVFKTNRELPDNSMECSMGSSYTSIFLSRLMRISMRNSHV